MNKLPAVLVEIGAFMRKYCAVLIVTGTIIPNPAEAQSAQVNFNDGRNSVRHYANGCLLREIGARGKEGGITLYYSPDGLLFLHFSRGLDKYNPKIARNQMEDWNVRKNVNITILYNFPNTDRTNKKLNRALVGKNIPIRDRPDWMDNGYAVNLPLSTLNFLNSHGGAKRIGAFNQLYSTGYAGFSGSLYIHNPTAALSAFRRCTSNVRSATPRRRPATGNPSDLQPLNERAVKMRMHQSYPTSAKREGRQGRVSYSVRVDADGRVSSCSVTQSSGYADIDETVCRSAKTLRFPAAESGNNRERSWSGTANFRLSQ